MMKEKMTVLLLDPNGRPMQWVITNTEEDYCHSCFNKSGAILETGYWQGERTIAFRCSVCGWLSIAFFYDHDKWLEMNKEIPTESFTDN